MRRTEAFMLQNPPTSLFPVAESDAADDDGALVTPLVTPAPRFNMPERFQGEFRAESLDQRLDADHDARLVWKLVEGLDLSVGKECTIGVDAVQYLHPGTTPEHESNEA